MRVVYGKLITQDASRLLSKVPTVLLLHAYKVITVTISVYYFTRLHNFVRHDILKHFLNSFFNIQPGTGDYWSGLVEVFWHTEYRHEGVNFAYKPEYSGTTSNIIERSHEKTVTIISHHTFGYFLWVLK